MALTARREKFCQEVASGKTATDAYRAAFSTKNFSDESLWKTASKIYNLPEVKSRIVELKEKVETKVVWDMARIRDRVLQHAMDTLDADPSDLITHRRLNCRYCHGTGHAYRWKNEPEFWAALGDASERQDAWDNAAPDKRPRKRPELPTDEGGFGFRRLHMPHPDCPECEGEGIEESRVADIRTLSGPARTLYQGVKVKKDGSIEVLTGDKAAARALLAKASGLVDDKIKITGAVGVMPLPALTPEQAAAVALALENKI